MSLSSHDDPLRAFEIGQTVRSLVAPLVDTDLKGMITGFDRKYRRVVVGWDDGVQSAERPEYIEVVE